MVSENAAFEPRILSFLCNWCSYAGADLAGVSRFQYPPTIRVIRVMCSGRVDPKLVLRALARGVDGVMILGCHPGDCHYATGNYYAASRAKVLGELLPLAGLSPDRVMLDWVSAGEGERFSKLVTAFTERISALGPLGESEGVTGDELQERLAAAARVVEDQAVRWLIGRERELVAQGNVFGEGVDEAAFDAMLESTVATEYLRSRLVLMSAQQPRSVKEMAGELALPPRQVLPHVVALEQAGLMSMICIEDRSPKYRSKLLDGNSHEQ